MTEEHAMVLDVAAPGTAEWAGRRFRCALGHGGVTRSKREGDSATPVGTFPLRRVMYRPDRLDPPATHLPVRAIRPEDGWCDDPDHPDYNRLVRLPFGASHETLWRDDRLYDVVVEVGYNDDPVMAGAGSAIFVHVAGGPDYPPTAGCVALALDDLLTVLADAGRESMLRVRAED